jgi:precorrin-3B synthase
MGTLLERTGTQAITQILEPHLRRGSVPNRPASAEHIGHRADQRWLGIGFPFGAATASELRFVADLARAPGRDVRVTPWRALIVTNIDERDAEAALKRAARLDLIVRADDPRRSLVACSGAPACPSAEAETRPLALTLARQLPAITSGSVLHISGCAKGCAQREPADVVVTACQGRYRLKFDAAPTDAGGPLLTAAEVLQHLEAQHSTGAS